MTRPHSIVISAALSLIACGPPATSVAAKPTDSVVTAGTLPPPSMESRDEPDGKPVSIRMTDGRRITLAGFKVDTRRSLSSGQCGVRIDGQRIMTMGTGDTEVYTCETLVAAGILPPSGRRQRIGLIYDVSSPNARFRTAVVLQATGSAWQVDPLYAGRFDDTPAGRGIPALRRALGPGSGRK